MKFCACAWLLLAGACAAAPAVTAPAQSPHTIAGEVLAADRAFAAAGASVNAVSALAAMFGDSVVMPVPGGRFAEGKTAAVAALQSNPDNVRSRLEWAPVRAGISADGRHGFTFGFMTLHRPDGTTQPLKYLAYWVRQPQGWRVLAYKRRPAPAGAPSAALLAPSLPPRLLHDAVDAALVARHRLSLEQTEREFSRDAQTIGLGAAFAKYGHADAMNMGGPDDAGFVIGADAIGRAVGAGTPTDSSPVSWSPDRVLVAGSGDLGITFGMIRANAPAAGAPANAVPFFTIWRRNSTAEPWRYIAE